MHLYLRYTTLLGILFASLFLHGCATMSLTQENRVKIKMVNISNKITAPKNIIYVGSKDAGSALGTAIGGVIGDAVSAGMSSNVESRIIEYQQKNNIDIKEIVKAEFIEEMASASVFDIKSGSQSKSDATVELEIYTYGLVGKTVFSTELRPQLGVRAKLVDAHGKVLWKNYGIVGQFSSNTSVHTLEEYFSKKNTLKNAYIEAAKLVSQMLVDELKPKS